MAKVKIDCASAKPVHVSSVYASTYECKVTGMQCLPVLPCRLTVMWSAPMLSDGHRCLLGYRLGDSDQYDFSGTNDLDQFQRAMWDWLDLVLPEEESEDIVASIHFAVLDTFLHRLKEDLGIEFGHCGTINNEQGETEP